MRLLIGSLFALSAGKIVMRGSNLVEEGELPEDFAKAEEIAEEADKRFQKASDKIMKKVVKSMLARGRKPFQLVKEQEVKRHETLVPNDDESYDDDDGGDNQ